MNIEKEGEKEQTKRKRGEERRRKGKKTYKRTLCLRNLCKTHLNAYVKVFH